MARLRAYLDGYYDALMELGVPEGNGMMARFQTKIERRFDLRTSHGWDQIIAFMSDNGEKGLNLFWELWDEHMETEKQKQTTDISVEIG